jgi:hypothetical protein
MNFGGWIEYLPRRSGGCGEARDRLSQMSVARCDGDGLDSSRTHKLTLTSSGYRCAGVPGEIGDDLDRNAVVTHDRYEGMPQLTWRAVLA